MTTSDPQQSVFNSLTFSVIAPEGKMFVTILEDSKGSPCAIQIHMGKSGAAINAWANSYANILTSALKSGVALSDLITLVSESTSDRAVKTKDGVVIKSGPQALMYVLLQYRRTKFHELEKKLGLDEYNVHGPYAEDTDLD